MQWKGKESCYQDLALESLWLFPTEDVSIRTEQANEWPLIQESHWWQIHARVYARDRIPQKWCMTGVNAAGILGTLGELRALRLCWGNSLLPGWYSRFARNVQKRSCWWLAGSGWAPLGALLGGCLGHVGGGHPASPTAGHTGAPRFCTSCCTDAPCLCYWGRNREDRV